MNEETGRIERAKGDDFQEDWQDQKDCTVNVIQQLKAELQPAT